MHLLVSYDVQVGSEALQEGSQIGLHLPEREGGGGAAGSGDHPGLEGMGEQWRRPRGGAAGRKTICREGTQFGLHGGAGGGQDDGGDEASHPPTPPIQETAFFTLGLWLPSSLHGLAAPRAVALCVKLHTADRWHMHTLNLPQQQYQQTGAPWNELTSVIPTDCAPLE